ncbi:MAG: MFS transporter [Chitinivibrionales bacterium]|nr:MFS transporter [Chitinivibrionales bacterium]MBD3355769.1 MFS transporter [Chitinivibrionales bacterium]
MNNGAGRKAVWGWVLYDWANSAFALSVMALFFPVFFKTYWCSESDPTFSTARLGIGHFIAGLTIALMSPILGAVAQIGVGKKRLLGGAVALGTTSVAALFLVPAGNWLSALTLFLLARLGFSFANLFYDSLLTDVAEPRSIDRVSSLGYGIGYLGCGLLGVAHVAMIEGHEALGIDKALAVRLAFLTAAVWWAFFSIPLFKWVREKLRPWLWGGVVKRSLTETWRTAREIGRSRMLLLFLVAFWFYNDGVHAVVMMAADFGASIGIPLSGLMIALLITQFVAFPSAIGFGRLAGVIGAKRAILIAIGIYIVVTAVAAFFLRTQTQFIILACIIGSAQGAIQALSRSLFASMIPPERAADFFGFYNLVGKFSVVIGPGLVGGMTLIGRGWGMGPEVASRIGIGSLAILFVVGGLLLSSVTVRPHGAV